MPRMTLSCKSSPSQHLHDRFDQFAQAMTFKLIPQTSASRTVYGWDNLMEGIIFREPSKVSKLPIPDCVSNRSYADFIVYILLGYIFLSHERVCCKCYHDRTQEYRIQSSFYGHKVKLSTSWYVLYEQTPASVLCNLYARYLWCGTCAWLTENQYEWYCLFLVINIQTLNIFDISI